MSIELKSGASADLLTIDPTSKGARATLYDAYGNPVSPANLGMYQISVFVKHAAATAVSATTALFSLRNPTGSGRTIYIRRILAVCWFEPGTAATPFVFRYDIAKQTAVTATSGGTQPTPAMKRTGLGAPIADIRLDAGGANPAAVTVTGATTQGVLGLAAGNMVTSTATIPNPITTTEVFEVASGEYHLELAANEALTLRPTATAVIGQCVTLTVEWSER